jgi:hypothetical protein
MSQIRGNDKRKPSLDELWLVRLWLYRIYEFAKHHASWRRCCFCRSKKSKKIFGSLPDCRGNLRDTNTMHRMSEFTGHHATNGIYGVTQKKETKVAVLSRDDPNRTPRHQLGVQLNISKQ